MELDVLDYFGEFEEDIKIVVLKYFYFESEARLYAARLKEAGINSFISNTNIVTALPLGEGGIGLHIRETDLSEALEIVQQLDLNKNQVAEQSFHDADLAEIEYQKQLNKTDKHQSDRVYWILGLLISLILIQIYLRSIGVLKPWQDYF